MIKILKYGLLSLFILPFAVCAEETAKEKEPDILLLQCKKGVDAIYNRLENRNPELVDNNLWVVEKNDFFYYIPFGTTWEEVEEACYAFSASIDVASYRATILYADKTECEEGIFGKEVYYRDAWNGYFEGIYTNTYDEAQESCNIKAEYRLVSEKAERIDKSKKRRCDLAKGHFYRSITDSNYGTKGWHRNWQSSECHEISKEVFEEKTGFTLEELKEQLAKHVI